MASTHTRLWISAWFVVSTLLVFWDAGYCLARPRSFPGGDLAWIWPGYDYYGTVDLIYGTKAYADNDGFTSGQAALNLVENGVNIAYLYLAHVQQSPLAPLIGLIGVTMTFWKTVLYWAQEYYCGGCMIGHNSWFTLIAWWIFPNGAWLVVPGIIAYIFGSDIARSLKTQQVIENVRKVD